jgi:anti-sigma factor RsiW
MSCKRIRPELVAFHFGTVSDPMRSEVETHLADCTPCLQEFFAIKAEIETAASVERPSTSARDRLRQAVLREVVGEVPVRPWAWWERPLAFGFASAAVVAAVFAVQVLATGEGALPHGVRDGSVEAPVR